MLRSKGETIPPIKHFISNGGTGRLDWEIMEGCFWINADPMSGTSFGEDNEIEVSVDITGLTEGEYRVRYFVFVADG